MNFRRRSNPGSGAASADHSPSVRPEDEKLPAHLKVTYGTQHILAMYAGVITPPLIVGAAAGLSTAEVGILVSAALLLSGIGTLLQTLGVWRFGAQLPVVIGISFVPVATMTVLAEESGLPVVFGAVLVSGVFALLVVPFFASLVRFFPPVVTGTVIMIIGISLVPVAVGWIADGGDDGVPLTSDLALAGVTLVIVLILTWVLPGVWSRMGVLGGLIFGTIIAAAFGMVDFSEIGEGAIFSFGQPFYFGLPEFQIAAIVIMCIVMMVILTEGVADILAVGEIVGTKVNSRRLADGLRVDAAATILAPILNTFPAGTFSQNVGLLALSRVASRHAVAFGGVLLIVLGLFPILGRVVAMIPMPVLGGAGLMLFGSVAAAGVRTLSQVDFNKSMNLVIVAVAVGFGVLPIAAPGFFDNFPDWLATIMHSGIVGAAILALLLNILFNIIGGGDSDGSDGSGDKATTAGGDDAGGEGARGELQAAAAVAAPNGHTNGQTNGHASGHTSGNGHAGHPVVPPPSQSPENTTEADRVGVEGSSTEGSAAPGGTAHESAVQDGSPGHHRD